MAKNKIDKKVNKIARQINKDLKKDVFGDRFWVRQVAKQRGDYEGCYYYLYELRDRLEPQRNSYFTCGWLWGSSQFLVSEFYEQVNDFIVKSDFWALHWNTPDRYDRKIDIYYKD